MKWFDQWLYGKVRDMWDNKHRYEEGAKVSTGLNLVARADDEISWGDGLRINVKRVNGGYIVSFRSYDRKIDRNEDRHYIITTEQDFNSELGKLITLESMKQV